MNIHLQVLVCAYNPIMRRAAGSDVGVAALVRFVFSGLEGVNISAKAVTGEG